jgi:acyl carrier protein
MNRTEINTSLASIMAEVFNEPTLELSDTLTAAEVEGWDSVSHIDMICAVEDHFGIQFSTSEIAGLQNVGELIDVVTKKLVP